MEFGDKLKKLRTARGLNQTALAERLGVRKSIISAYESQMRMPSLEMLVKIALCIKENHHIVLPQCLPQLAYHMENGVALARANAADKAQVLAEYVSVKGNAGGVALSI